jgi:hypothetical protein
MCPQKPQKWSKMAIWSSISGQNPSLAKRTWAKMCTQKLEKRAINPLFYPILCIFLHFLTYFHRFWSNAHLFCDFLQILKKFFSFNFKTF